MLIRVAKDWYFDEWGDVFQLDSSSPSGISWKIKRGRNLFPGTFAGCKDVSKWSVEYKGRGIMVHRIVYYLSYGKLDHEMCIDHIDGNPHNNDISNLREITYTENCRNKKLAVNNNVGFGGVTEMHKFIATWSEDGEQKSKSFKVSTYGYEEAKAKAIAFREKKLQELNDKGYGYTDRHGTKLE